MPFNLVKISSNSLIFVTVLFLISDNVFAQDTSAVEPTSETETETETVNKVLTEEEILQKTITTLKSFVTLKKGLQKDIKSLNKQIKASQSDGEKLELKLQLDKLQQELRTTIRNFEDIAANTDMLLLRDQVEEEFNFQKEFFSLLRPAIDEMKEMTSHVRKKADLKEQIESFELRLPIIEEALSNINLLQKQAKNKSITRALKSTKLNWEKQQSFMQSELQASRHQLDQMLATETSISQASQSYLKSFFQKRGLYLLEAVMAVIVIILISKFINSGMQRLLPGFRAKHRAFRIRLLELVHRIVTFFLIVLGPMVVFYIGEDWVLFSLGILILFAIAWTLRQALPRYWQQINLFLNIGSVREGERIFIENLPWRVEKINVFCRLVNPVANLSQRVPINDLVDLKSRPYSSDEPWFPCKKDDWVILSDGIRGKVTGISPEMVQLVERGGAKLTYQTGNFLAASPRNLASNFRIKEVLGISYSLQKESTSTIPEVLQEYLKQCIEQEGYGDQLLNLRVEFEKANSSSLDLVVIADFKGDSGDVYNRLRRAIQRWCVQACSENNWEIPYPQLDLHQS